MAFKVKILTLYCISRKVDLGVAVGVLKGLLHKKKCVFFMVDWPCLDEFKDTLVASKGPPLDLIQVCQLVP